MRIATVSEGKSYKRLVANKGGISTRSIRNPLKKWLPSCKTSGLRRNVESIFRPWTSPEGQPSSLVIAHQPSSWWIVHQHSKLRIANRHSKEES